MAMREYRKGNWTVEETMILIEAKKKDDERRKLSRSKQTLQTAITSIGSSSSSGGGGSSKPITELRWKWVEEYCWGKGCFRSQNQCNDKWDNLMRDYKKVRDYQKINLLDSEHEAEMRTASGSISTSDGGSKDNVKSYWIMDKVERKDKGLPTNMLLQIYQALFDVVELSSTPPTPTPTPTATTTASLAATHFLLPPPVVPPLVLPASPLLSSPPPLLPPPPSAFQLPPHLSPTLESEPHSHDPELSSPAKRRRKEEGIAAATAAAAMTTEAAATSEEAVRSEISRSATMISEAIQASEEREERRHREMMTIQKSRLRIEESKLEINRQGFNGLTEAINRLAASIFTWANSHKNQQGPS